MQTIIVIIIVCLAAVYVVKTFWKKSSKKGECGCGCSSCPTEATCADKKQADGQASCDNAEKEDEIS